MCNRVIEALLLIYDKKMETLTCFAKKFFEKNGRPANTPWQAGFEESIYGAFIVLVVKLLVSVTPLMVAVNVTTA